MAERHPGYVRHEHFTESRDRLGAAAIAELCDDWRDRYTLASGPGELLDAITEHWEAEGDPELLDMERFQPRIGGGADGSGGTVRFRVTDVEAKCDTGVPILVGGADSTFIGNRVYNFALGGLGNLPYAAAFAAVPLVIMGIYLVLAKRTGAFEAM